MAGALVLLLAAGCAPAGSGVAGEPGDAVSGAARHPGGPFPGLKYRDGGVAKMSGARSPASAALPGANDFLTSGTGVLAATDLGIWRSADGGTSWRQVLAGIAAWSLTTVPGGGYAAVGNRPGGDNFGPAIIATSGDGISWSVTPARAPGTGYNAFPFGYGYRIVMSGIGPRAIGIAVPDMVAAAVNGPPMRSTDGGRTWAQVQLPRGSETLTGASSGLYLLADGRTAYLTAPGPGSKCLGAVYRSADAGATWTLLPGSCQPYPLLAVRFVSTAQGFAAGGEPSKFGGGQVVEATTDGGRAWQTLWQVRQNPGGAGDSGFVRLDMVSARIGWALAGGCVGGQNGPCGGTVFATSDGGAHWRGTGQEAIGMAGLGAGRAMAGYRGTLAVTTDGGLAWKSQAPPRWVNTLAFTGAGAGQLWTTNLGQFRSTDGGIRWSSADSLRATHFSYYSWSAAAPDRLLGYPNGSGMVTTASGDGGRTWTTAVVPDPAPASDQLLTVALGTSGTAMAVTGQGAECMSTEKTQQIEQEKPGWRPPPTASWLFTSSDGGARWRRTGPVLPFGVGYQAMAAVDGQLMVIVDACGRVQISSDGGTHWRAGSVGTTYCQPSVYGGQIWLACAVDLTSWVLRSSDDGSTWIAYRLPAWAATNGLGTFAGHVSPMPGIGGIYATGPDTAVIPAGGSIWRTADGGASWTQSWPVLIRPVTG